MCRQLPSLDLQPRAEPRTHLQLRIQLLIFPPPCACTVFSLSVRPPCPFGGSGQTPWSECGLFLLSLYLGRQQSWLRPLLLVQSCSNHHVPSSGLLRKPSHYSPCCPPCPTTAYFPHGGQNDPFQNVSQTVSLLCSKHFKDFPSHSE